MWLLSTDRAELHFFAQPSSVPGGYAILSHTWSQSRDTPEQSFQDLQGIIARCNADSKNPRDHVSPKIRECCKLAEKNRYLWVWVDTCCINKESSTELSEAINSMFSWYVLSEVCYAHLEDVSSDDTPEGEDSEFRHARWHLRGWTLQELLAPAFVVFMSRDWKVIGTKHELAETLGQITGIYRTHLTREKAFLSASIAEKMSWAAKRKTTRTEDEAYCLLGLFNISLPTLYGEGRQAFFRLQVELARLSFDTTLFAWGGVHDSGDDKYPQEPLEEIWSGFHDVTHYSRYLFAPSTSDFTVSTPYYTPRLNATAVLQPYMSWQWTEDHEKVIDVANKTTGPFGSLELPSFKLTSHGMKCHFPVAEVDGITIMVLLVETDDKHLGMILHPAKADEVQDPSQQLFYVTWAFKTTESYSNCRLAELGGDLYNLNFRGKDIKPVWRDIYIHAGPRTEDRTDPPHLVLRLMHDRIPAPFRVPRWLVGAFASMHFLPNSGTSTIDEGASFEMWLQFVNTQISERMWVKMGLCKQASTDDEPVHWAWGTTVGIAAWNDAWDKPHDCATDHVDEWEGKWRSFGDEERTIRLSFTQDGHNKRTRVLHMELDGTKYNELQKQANVSICDMSYEALLAKREGLRAMQVQWLAPSGHAPTPAYAPTSDGAYVTDPSSAAARPAEPPSLASRMGIAGLTLKRLGRAKPLTAQLHDTHLR
ncbi:HET-domain-containing protein [Epithele typhae]|uniref:HET-domain-containing protein n=1 Tax=Epithele typhae TaxID=378194 RepID=UPI002007D2F6|nr:HET-domain-containing protein [Epithele typhae]KAH9935222.1 HET-domain-containing protein [Epithele typhae]